MADITVSTDIDAFMSSADNAAARNSLGVVTQLDVTSSSILSNTVATTGPSYAQTTNGILYYVPSGEALPADNATALRVVVTDADGNLTMLQKIGLDSARLVSTPLAGELLWTTDLRQLWMGDGSTIGGISTEKQRPSARYVKVGSWGTPAQAGERLLAALQHAKDLIPTSTDRVRVLVGAGSYEVASDIEMDTEYLELYGENVAPWLDANDYQNGSRQGVDPLVKIVGGDIKCSAMTLTVANVSMAAGFGIFVPVGTVGFGHAFFNCFSAECSPANGSVDPWGQGAGTMAMGRYMWCVSGKGGFGSNGGQASGDFYQCSSGEYGFGGDGTSSGSFVDCVGQVGSFGGGASGVSSGRYIRCLARSTIGDPGSFGGSGGAASGYYRDCKDNGKGFGGGGGSFSGEAINCESHDFSGTLTGKLRFCTCSDGSFATVSGGGTTRYCLNADETTDNQG